MQNTTNDTNTSEYSPVTTQPNETAEQSDTPLTSEPVKPRSEWDEDERLDGRAKTNSIQVLVVPPAAAPYTQIIGNNLDAMQAVVQGLITTFETGIEGVIGVANDEALMDGLPLNRQITATGSGIFGTFFLAGDGINFHSLSPEEIEHCSAVFAEQITYSNSDREAVATGNDRILWVVVVPPGQEPYALTIGNSIEDIEAMLDGSPVHFDTRIDGVIGLANADAVRDRLPLNRIDPVTLEPIHGVFILVATAQTPSSYSSLTSEQSEACIAEFSLKLEVLVFRPEELPFVTTIAANPKTGYLPALQHQIAEPHPIAEVKPFGVATFDVPVLGAVGLCHKSNTDGTVLQIDVHHFPPNRRVIYMPSMFYGTFVVAAGTGMDDLSSLSPQMLEKLLDAFAPELEASEFEQVMHGHSLGAEYMSHWD